MHPLDPILTKYDLKKKDYKKIRARYDRLDEKPTDVYSWLERILRGEWVSGQPVTKAVLAANRIAYEVRRRQEKEAEQRRRRSIVRLTPRNIDRIASAIDGVDYKDVHPDDEQLIRRRNEAITELRRERAQQRAKSALRRDPLRFTRERLIALDEAVSEHRRRLLEPKLVAKIGGLRRRKNRGSYESFLLECFDALRANQRAKNRAANGLRRDEYLARDSSDYAMKNYDASRWARDKDYDEKEQAIDGACRWAREAGIRFGWMRDAGKDRVPWVVYFELPTGQISFHSPTRGEGPDYTGRWDGQHKTAWRIAAAIRDCLGVVVDVPSPAVVARSLRRRSHR